jgi:hypothetical protein
MTAASIPGPRDGLIRRLSDVLMLRPRLLLLVLLIPPLGWIGIVYVGSLLSLLAQSFFSIDEFTGQINRQFTLKTYGELLQRANLDIIIRTVVMAAAVTLTCAAIGFPIAYYAARYARGKVKALFYIAVTLPLWSSYLVRVYAWKLILAREGILTWFFDRAHLTPLLDFILALPVIGDALAHLWMLFQFGHALPDECASMPQERELRRTPLGDLGERVLWLLGQCRTSPALRMEPRGLVDQHRLRLEVPEERDLVHPGFLGDATRGRSPEAGLGEDAHCRVQQLLSTYNHGRS